MHPIEEGIAYRKLIEDSGYEVKSIAAKVGKSDTYVRQRLFLTNLNEKAQKAYRNGKFNDGFAVEIAKLSPDNQLKVVDKVCDPHSYNRIDTLKELKDYIQNKFYSSLNYQPWLKSKEVMEAVGPCKECPPDNPTLFGEVKKEGACTSLKCWNRKMEKFIQYNLKKDKELLQISSNYSESKNKNIIRRGEYDDDVKGKKKCEFAQKAIIVEGEGLGKFKQICVKNTRCKKHWNYISTNSNYAQTPEEKQKAKEKRKKEIAAAKKRHENNSKKFIEALNRLKYPISQKHLDALLEFAFERCGYSRQQPAVKLLGVDIIKKEEKVWGSKKVRMVSDYEATLRKFAKDGGNTSKLKTVFALLIPHPGNSEYDDGKDFRNALKKL